MSALTPAPKRGRYDRRLSRAQRVHAQHERLLLATAQAHLEGELSVEAVVKRISAGRATFYEFFDDVDHALAQVRALAAARITSASSAALRMLVRDVAGDKRRDDVDHEDSSVVPHGTAPDLPHACPPHADVSLKALCEAWINCVVESPLLFASALSAEHSSLSAPALAFHDALLEWHSTCGERAYFDRQRAFRQRALQAEDARIDGMASRILFVTAGAQALAHELTLTMLDEARDLSSSPPPHAAVSPPGANETARILSDCARRLLLDG